MQKRRFPIEIQTRFNHWIYVRCVGLENICDASGNQASDESVIPNVLPSFLLVLFAGLDAEKISAWGIIVATVVSSTQLTPRREGANGLRLAQKTARAKDEGWIASRHCAGCCRERNDVSWLSKRSISDAGVTEFSRRWTP